MQQWIGRARDIASVPNNFYTPKMKRLSVIRVVESRLPLCSSSSAASIIEKKASLPSSFVKIRIYWNCFINIFTNLFAVLVKRAIFIKNPIANIFYFVTRVSRFRLKKNFFPKNFVNLYTRSKRLNRFLLLCMIVRNSNDTVNL